MLCVTVFIRRAEGLAYLVTNREVMNSIHSTSILNIFLGRLNLQRGSDLVKEN